MLKLQKVAVRVFLILLLLFVAYCLWQSCFILPNANIWTDGGLQTAALCIAVATIAVLLLFMIYNWLHKISDKKARVVTIIAVAVIVVGQLIWLVYVWNNNVFPSTDLATNTQEALRLMKNGYFPEDSSVAIYPFNRTHILLLYFYYNLLNFFGITAYWKASIILSMICMDISVLFSYLSAKEMFDQRKACILIILCLANPITYLCLPYYYTSITGMPFLMAAFYFCIKLISEKRISKSIIYACFVGVLSVLGYNLRGTGVFPLIALVVFGLFYISKKSDKKIALLKLGVCILCLFITMNITSKIEYYYDSYDRTETKPPFSHGIMMGLQGDGGYLQSDLDYTLSFPTKEERQEANYAVIEERLEEMGVGGFLELMGRKTQYTWAHGHSRFTNWYGYSSEYISGKRADFIVLYSQAYRVMMWVLVLGSVVSCMKKKKQGLEMMPLIILFGGFLLHILIESNPQYAIPFMFVLMLSTIDGCSALLDKVNLTESPMERKSFWKRASIWGLVALLLVGVSSVEYYKPFVVTNRYYTDVVAKQSYRSTTIGSADSEVTSIEQTFVADSDFDMIKVGIYVKNNEMTEDLFRVQLLDSSSNCVFEETFGVSDLSTSDSYKKFMLPETVKVDDKQEYVLTIEPLTVESFNYLAFRGESKLLDYYPAGQIYLNGEQYGDYDLQFYVEKEIYAPLHRKEVYMAFWTVLICAGAVVTGYCIKKQGKLREKDD